ncbi:MAG: 1-acyl-sn-glycerol-3-phosphate acyltransferase [Actinomycetia bacterium]|nr:1-acyl-sn-glycerol-3-phosphate acyltransferase [Actinomycetes bacterium]
MNRRPPPLYRTALRLVSPVVRGWGRLSVTGAELLDTARPILAVVNHDSHWDPLAVAVAGRRRHMRALAKASLWRNRVLAAFLNGVGQIPIERGQGDRGALDAAARALRAGECIGIFAEGTISRGVPLRAHSGAGRLAKDVPEAMLLCVRVIGATDMVRFPKRPRLRVEFFEPGSGPARPDESAAAIAARLLAEIRAGAPPMPAGRRRKRRRIAKQQAEAAR